MMRNEKQQHALFLAELGLNFDIADSIVGAASPGEGPGLWSLAVGRLPRESPALLSPPAPGAAAPRPSLCLLSSTSGLVSVWGPGELVRAAEDSGKPETTGEH